MRPPRLAEISPQSEHPLRRALPDLDFVLTYGGGPPVIGAYEGLGAKVCRPIYNALDPTTHHPVASVRTLRPRPELPGQSAARSRTPG
jgi:spore maturation protein CgeB